MTPKILVDATSEPLTLAEARLQCRVDPIDDLDSDGNGTHPDDALIEMLITAAREHCEQYLGMSLVPKTLEIALNEFPAEDDGAIELPFGPVNEIVSVTVGTGTDSTMDEADYVLDDFTVPNRLMPASGSWTAITASLNTIRVIYTVGYDGPDSSDGPTIPRGVLLAMKLLIADWYKHREDTDVHEMEITNGAMVLLRPHRVRRGFA